uniref:Uncharacterized protein n=1 Tax=Rhizophora mucronata TaxID=61149 RepID=A0A2P2QBA5_RHIMU
MQLNQDLRIRQTGNCFIKTTSRSKGKLGRENRNSDSKKFTTQSIEASASYNLMNLLRLKIFPSQITKRTTVSKFYYKNSCK